MGKDSKAGSLIPILVLLFTLASPNCPWVWTLQTWAWIQAGIQNLGQVVGMQCQVSLSGRLLVSIPEGQVSWFSRFPSFPNLLLCFHGEKGGQPRPDDPCLLAIEDCALQRHLWVWMWEAC